MGGDDQQIEQTTTYSPHHQQNDKQLNVDIGDCLIEKEVDEVDITNCEDLDCINLDLDEDESYFSKSDTNSVVKIDTSMSSNNNCKREIELIILDDSSNESIISLHSNSELLNNTNKIVDKNVNNSMEQIQVPCNDGKQVKIIQIDSTKSVLNDNILGSNENSKLVTEVLVHDKLSHELKSQNDSTLANKNSHNLINESEISLSLSCEDIQIISEKIISQLDANPKNLELISGINILNSDPKKNENVLNFLTNNNNIDELELLADLESDNLDSNQTFNENDIFIDENDFNNILEFAPTLEITQKDLEDVCPFSWSKSWQQGLSGYQLLQSNESVYQNIHKRFVRTVNNDLKVETIARIENLFTLLMYELKRLEITQLHGSCQELVLYHGTKAKYVSSIREDNFDWRCFGKDHKFGKGVYFTPLSSYASYYTDEFATGNKMMLVRMLFVEACLGKDDMNYPPFPNDTAVNRERKVYCKFDDHTFYPEYEITYEGKLINWYLLKKHGLLEQFQRSQQYDYSDDYMDNRSGFVDFNSPLANDLIRIRSRSVMSNRNVNTQFIQPWLRPPNEISYPREELGPIPRHEPLPNIVIENGHPVCVFGQHVSDQQMYPLMSLPLRPHDVVHENIPFRGHPFDNLRPNVPSNFHMERNYDPRDSLLTPQFIPPQQVPIEEMLHSENNFYPPADRFQRQVTYRSTMPPSHSNRGRGLGRSKQNKKRKNAARKLKRRAKDNLIH